MEYSTDLLTVTRINGNDPSYLVNGTPVESGYNPSCPKCSDALCWHCRAVEVALEMPEEAEAEALDMPF